MVELISYKIGWLESRQEWRAQAVFSTPYGERKQSAYYPEGSKPSNYQGVMALQAEAEQWAADVRAMSLVEDEVIEEVPDGS